jgi:peptide deformylase
MAALTILTAPDPALKTVSKPVAAVTDAERALMKDMLETMYRNFGIGLAGIQVGVPKRILVMDLADEGEKPSPRFFVNPVITWTSEETALYNEGCLSVPEHYADVERPAKCRVSFLDYDGTAREIEAEGLLATCLQHEMDHLDGILFIDRISDLKRKMILKKLTKAQREELAQHTL